MSDTITIELPPEDVEALTAALVLRAQDVRTSVATISVPLSQVSTQPWLDEALARGRRDILADADDLEHLAETIRRQAADQRDGRQR